MKNASSQTDCTQIDPIMSPVEGLILFDGTNPQRRP